MAGPSRKCFVDQRFSIDAGAIGTASTGTSIATLSGAAATKATLAAIGGGSVVSGGLGVVGGMFILSGGAITIGATTSYLAYKYFYKRRETGSQ